MLKIEFRPGVLTRYCLGLVVALLPVLSGCGGMPSAGPAAIEVAFNEADSVPSPDRYVLVNLDATALDKINSFLPLSLPNEFKARFGGTRATTIGIGDALVVNVWEASPDGLFSTAEKKQTSLQVVVDEAGEIFIPYVGRIRAAGKSAESLRRAIEEGLTGKAAEPQVQVLITDNKSNSVVVVGDVAKPGQYPLLVRGMRLMEAIAQAGGTREATFETVATVTRGKRTGTVRLDEVVTSPQNNIWLAPGDNVLLLHKPRTYTAFGAVKSNGLVPFKTENLTVAEALAQVGGLRDATADAGGVFLFRFENEELARWLVQSGHGIGTYSGHTLNMVPVVYRLDFKDPQAFFLARSFKMRDKDIIYVATHPTAEFSKFLSTIVSPLVGTTRNVSSLSD